MDLSAKSILVTGGAGFIGSHLVKGFNHQGCADLVIVDHLRQNAKWKNLASLRYVAYLDRDELFSYLEHKHNMPDVIIHMGACSATTEKDENYLLNNNTKYTKRLFDYCAENNVRFIYASSAATYGNGSLGYSDQTQKLHPLNCYGYSKYLFDQWALSGSSKPPQWVGLKFFNVYGPNEYHKDFMASMVFHGYQQIKENGKIRLFKSYRKDFADGCQKRDFVYIADVLNVVNFFLQHEDQSGIFNVGTGMARSFNDLAQALFRALAQTPNIEYIEMPPDLRAKYQYFTQADISSLRGAGYTKEFYSLENGIKDCVACYQIKEK